MQKKLLVAAAAMLLFPPLLFSEMTGVQGMGEDRSRPDAVQPVHQPAIAPLPETTAAADKVNEILLFENKLGLTGQQVISIRLIAADAQQEAARKSAAVQDYQRSYVKSLNENRPDFADIRARLSTLTDAQAGALAITVDAYEKAYLLLTDDQKAKLAFFKAIRQQELEKKAAAAAAENTPPPPPSSPINTLSPASGRSY